MSFILITNDQSSLSGSTVPAIKIVKFRLTKGSWPIYPGTKSKDKIKVNDKCIIYIAGRLEHRQNFVSYITVKAIRESKYSSNNVEENELRLSTPMPIKTLIFEPTDILKPIYIKDIMKKLDFTKKASTKWGTLMMGGVKIISNNDSRLLLELLKNN
jgi:predicted RNA-binding protein